MEVSKLKELLQKKLNAENEDDIKKLIIQFIKFGLVGVSNTLVSWACYYFFLWIDKDLYMVGSVVGTVLSIANAFIWNDLFVFKGQQHNIKSILKRLVKTYISYGATSLLGILLLWIEVRFFHISKAIAPPVNLVITIPINFLINKFWTFKHN